MPSRSPCLTARIVPVVAAGLGLLLGGCGADDETTRPGAGEAVSVSDSAGVRVLEIDWDLVRELRSPAGEPTVVLGDGDATGYPHGIPDATRLADGRVAFADGATGQVVVAEPDGRGARRHGGTGRGPGEFLAPTRIFEVPGVSGEGEGRGSLRVLDAGSRGWVTVDPEGGVGDRIPLEPVLRSAIMTAGWAPPGAGALGEGGDLWAFVVTAAPIPTEPGESRPVGAVLRIPLPLPGSGGPLSAADTVDHLPGPAFRMGPDYAGLVLLSSTGVVAAGPGGAWFGDTGVARVRGVRRLDASGSAEATAQGAAAASSVEVRWRTGRSLDVTQAMRDDIFASMLEVASSEERAFLEEMSGSMVFAERLPHFEALVVGEDGTLWIGRHEGDLGEVAQRAGTRRSAQEWLVVEVGAATAERVRMPAGFRLLRAGPDWVLGVMRDERGVETVRIHALEGIGQGR